MRPHDGRAIPTFVRQALENKPLTVFGDGSQTRSFCYVDDLIRGLLPARDERRAPAREPRQPGRVHDPRAGGNGASSHRVEERDRLRGAARRRPAGAPARHHPRPAGARLAARGRARGRPSAHAADVWSRSVRRAADRSRRSLPLLAGLAASRAAAPSPRAALIVGIFDEQSTLGDPDWAFPQYNDARRRGAARQPLLGRPERRRSQAAARERGRPGRPGLRLVGVRRDGQALQGERDQARLLDPLDAVAGPARRRTARRAGCSTCGTSRTRPPSATAEASGR